MSTGSSRSALVTGASSGIGKAFALELGSRVHELVIVGRNHDDLLDTEQQVRALNGACEVTIVLADLSTPDGTSKVCGHIENTAPDTIIACAGTASYEPWWEASTKAHDAQIDVNYRAASELVRNATRQMLQRGSGDIIVVSSVAGIIPGDPDISYAATKGALVNLVESLATTLKGTGIRISVTCPGYSPTNIHRRAGFPQPDLPGFLWQSPREVAVTTLRQHEQGHVRIVPSLPYRVVVTLSAFVPAAVKRSIAHRIYRSENPLTR